MCGKLFINKYHFSLIMDYIKRLGPISSSLIDKIKIIMTSTKIKKKIKQEILSPILLSIFEILNPFIWIYCMFITIILILLIVNLTLTYNIMKKIKYQQKI